MKEQLTATLQNSRNYTVQVAEAMPDDAYDHKPKGLGWNFRELLSHIAYGIQWWEANYIKGTETPWNPPAAKSNKKQVIDYLNQAYDELEKTISKGKLSDKAIQGFHSTLDHITHHRGQAVMYLRSHGITPPEYTY